MIALNHVLLGGAIGANIDNYPAVIGLSVASHFVLDFLPHVDQGTEINGRELKFKLKYFLATLDVLVSSVIIVLILSARPGLNRYLVIIGAFSALLVDLVFNVPFWQQWTKKIQPFKAIDNFHEAIHRPFKKYQYSVGIPLQIIIIIMSLWLLLK